MADDPVAQFMSITGANDAVAAGCLSMTEGDVMAAVNLFFENPDIARSFPAQPSSAAPASSSTAATSRAQGASSSRNLGRQDDQGVIHIDDDDDEDDDPIRIDDDDDVDVVDHSHLERIAQESDDAAMARRLQEEMYGGGSGPSGADDVRAPIARTTETLVAPSGYGAPMDDDGFGMLEQLRRQPRPRGNPFGQSIWEDPDHPPQPPTFASAAGGSSGEQNRAQRLADLFRPPYELMEHYPWDEARDIGKEDKKWILVNVQDMNDFNCQALNRDIWKDPAIVALVKENFIFLQYAKDDPRAGEYNTFYFPPYAQENKDNFPHVSIIDPRTGEKVKGWTGIPFPSAQAFHADLVEFLDRYSLEQNKKNPVSKQKRPQPAVDVNRMTEEEMLEMALRNSLDANGGNGSSSANALQDPDDLTKSVELEKGKGKEVATSNMDEIMGGTPQAEPEEVAQSASSSVFASIASDKPHSEPANGPTVTRIQFRHPEGRVIRRFNVTDPIRQIYEWLKSEPIAADKAGVEFELKTVPEGKDLIELLDQTIEEAGLKQATVMIEYIEA
ncbi:hypothetical protein J7T55_007597 [Diaporthe amygdali]|uniref:uncharacterized protein n=1 Tax=Phomopsis amygdali TaxID=1214568 RepID=UPI0022FF051A|nr:uncharacterized protein J7T55_007597 [Diaporthe amygdali]KAJ0107227.1 hypothetical protein J7T55_007597 [Diaporthe amygdali]